VTVLEMGDAATPPSPPAPLPVFGFYIGGDTPHVWTEPEIRALDARWGLPIYVHTDPASDPNAVAADCMAAIRLAGLPNHITVAFDTESVAMPGIVTAVNDAVTGSARLLMEYESKGPAGQNPPTSGGRWIADWTGVPHIYPGSLATQYADPAIDGHPWDASVIDATVPLLEIHPPVVHKIPIVSVTVALPELASGDSGPAVRRAQHLLLAHNGGCLPGSGTDGIYGPETTAAVRGFQRNYGITANTGVVTAETWTKLLTG
jgi:hypothetical protein